VFVIVVIVDCLFLSFSSLRLHLDCLFVIVILVDCIFLHCVSHMLTFAGVHIYMKNLLQALEQEIIMNEKEGAASTPSFTFAKRRQISMIQDVLKQLEEQLNGEHIDCDYSCVVVVEIVVVIDVVVVIVVVLLLLWL
jgi:hypothetical protein